MNKRNWFSVVGFCFVTAFVLTGCGGGGGDSTIPPSTSVDIFFDRGDAVREVFFASYDGTAPATSDTVITNSTTRSARQVSLSPDGTVLVFSSDRVVLGSEIPPISHTDFLIYKMNDDGTGVVALTNSLAPIGGPWQDSEPSISNAVSGIRTIAFTSTRTRAVSGDLIAHGIYITDDSIWTSGKPNPTRLIQDSSFNSYDQSMPAISPDGTKVIFASSKGGGGKLELWLYNRTNDTAIQLTINSYDDRDPRFSPDGTKVVFCSERGGSRDIWIMNADGTNQLKLTTDTIAGEFYPSISSDGNKIIYISNSGVAGGNNVGNINVMDIDGSNNVNGLTTGGKDAYPSMK